jgi:hypothetical protein
MSMVERIEGRIDREVTSAVALRRSGTGLAIAPETLEQALELAKVMSTARGMIPEHLLGNPGACADVVFQALSWSMNPFALAKMSYIAQRGGTPSYMSQAISGAVNNNPALLGRMRLSYDGVGDDMTCTVTGVFRDDPDHPQVYTTPRIKDIQPKNSPLWKTDPGRQLGYWAQRAWSRLYASDILMGVYDADEFTPEMLAKSVTPVDPFAGEGPRVPAIGEGGPSSPPSPANPDAAPSPAASANSEASASASYSEPGATPSPAPDGADQSGKAGESSAHGSPATFKDPETIAHWAGKQARASGQAESQNPFDENSPQWLAWIEGFHGRG